MTDSWWDKMKDGKHPFDKTEFPPVPRDPWGREAYWRGYTAALDRVKKMLDEMTDKK